MTRGVPNTPGRQCGACSHNKHPEIDKAVVLRETSLKDIGEKYGLHHDVLQRHQKHIGEAKKRRIIAQASRDVAVHEQQGIADSLNDDRIEIQGGLIRCVKKVEAIIERAEGENNDPLALASIKEMRSTLMDLAKVYGALKSTLTIEVSLADSPEWYELRVILMDLFQEFPEAGREFARRVKKLNVDVRP